MPSRFAFRNLAAPAWGAALFGGLAALSALLLAALVPISAYADPSAPQGRFFATHAVLFAPLYTLLGAQGMARGLLWLAIGGAVYIALALLYRGLLRSLWADSALVDMLWGSYLHWLALGLVWLGLLLAYPLLSDDTIYYLVNARLVTHYGANPYLPESRALLVGDPWNALLGPTQQLSLTYGPIWLYISVVAALLSGPSLSAALLGIKLINGGLLLLCGLVIWHLMDGAAPWLRRAALLGLLWNPLIWLEAVWSGHNDVAMMLWVLLALLALRRGHPILGFGLLMGGVATKYVPLLLLPLLLADAVRRRGQGGHGRWLLGSAAGSGLVLALGYTPVAWGHGAAIFVGLQAHAAKLNPSVGGLLQMYAGPALGDRLAALIMPSLLLVWCGWCAWRVWRGGALADTALLLLIAYMFVLSSWLMPWYGIWLVLLAPLAQPDLRRGLWDAALILPLYYVINIVPLPAWLIVLVVAGLPLLLIVRQQRSRTAENSIMFTI